MTTNKKKKIDLELLEDEIWDRIASERDTKDAKFVSHEETWM